MCRGNELRTSGGRAAFVLAFTLFATACGGGSDHTSTATTGADQNGGATTTPPPPPPASFDLTVALVGAGMVTSNPAGIDCGSDCTETYADNTTVVLTATPAVGFSFAGWSGSDISCPGAGTCGVTMNVAQRVTATFSPINATTYSLQINRSGAGAVTSVPAGIDCGNDCSESYASGTSVTLTAAPASGNLFGGWNGGGCAGTGACTVTMTAARTTTATFVPSTFPLNVAVSGSGNVMSAPGGIDCGTSCATSYNVGTSVTLTAAPASDFSFSGWSGDCSGTGSCVLGMTVAHSVGASFVPITFPLNVSVVGAGTVSSSPAGINCGATCSASYNSGTSVTLTAVPASGFSFGGWSGACAGTGACNIAMTVARTATATFVPITFPLTVSVAGSGTVTSTPAGIDCGATCTASYDSGTSVTLTAMPAAGFSFSGWSGGGCTGNGTCIVAMTAARTATAAFVPITFPLNVSVSGSGSITSSPAGINCGTTCVASYDTGTSVTLTAVPAAGSSFSGWNGDCSGNGSCTVTMTGARAVTATFVPITFPLTVSVSGSGTVTSSPSGIDCGASCNASYNSGTTVALTATPASGFTFSGWTGACTGTACTLTMSAARSVTATFVPVTFDLSVSVSGSGTVASSPAGINCGGACNASYDNGTSVTLTATPTAGFMFSAWGGACAGTGTCSLTMTAARSVTATFVPVTFDLNVSVSGSGTVTSSPGGINCGTACNANYDSGTSVTLTATPAAGFGFSGWGGACVGASTCTLAMTSARSVTATFAPVTFDLNVSVSGSGTVTSSPSGINCGSICTAGYNSGTSVTLTASAASGFNFAGWSGACTGTESCVLDMSAARSVTATFSRITFTLNVTVSGPGSVSSSPEGISCGSTCSASYNSGTSVTLMAAAASGATFSAWGGACAGTGACTLTMSAASSVTASFTTNSSPRIYQLTWDPVSDPRVSGYKLYFSTVPLDTSAAGTAVDVGNDTTYAFDPAAVGILAGATVYFGVTAIAPGLESPLSNVVSVLVQ